jgi:type VI secretion system secreted protein Hcp
MNAPRIRAILLASGALILAPAARGAVDAFIWFDTIKGESKDPQHLNWIEVESFELQQLNNSTIGSATTGAGAGKIQFSEFTIKKTVDNSSPALFQAFSAHAHFPKVIVEMRKAGGSPQEYLKLTLEVVFLSSYSVDTKRGQATETAKLAFGRMKMESVHPPKPVTAPLVAVAPGALKAGPTATPTPAGRTGVVNVPVAR